MNKLRSALITATSFAVVGIIAFFTINVSWLNPIKKVLSDFSMTDIYYQILQDTSEPEQNNMITIVDMTDLYRRSDIADVLHQIEECHPKIIGIDIVFEGLKEDTLGDLMIQEVASTYDNIVFSYKLLYGNRNDSTETVHSFFADSIPTINEGFTNMPRQLYGGMKRTLSIGDEINGEVRPSFITKVTEGYTGTAVKTEDKDININYTPTEFTILSSDSILAHPELIVDRIVLFGAMKEENDMHYTPLGKIAGVELLGYAVNTMLQRKNIIEVSGIPMAIASFLLAWLVISFFLWEGKKVKDIKNTTVRIILSTGFINGIILFFWWALFMWIAFILFCQFNISFNVGWAYSAMVMRKTATEVYTECANLFNRKKN